MTYVGKQGSLTLSESTNHHQFSFLFPLQMSPWQILATLILPRFTLSSPKPLHRKCWRREECGFKLIWKPTANSALQNIPLGKAISAAGSGKAGRSASSLSPQPQERGTLSAGAWHSAMGPCTASRALVQSQVSADCSWGTSRFFFLQKRFRRACSWLLCFYHLSNNSARQRRFLDLSLGPRLENTLSFWRATEKPSWKASK